MDNALRELYQEVILDHSRHPRHYGAMGDASHKAEGYNPLCGDKVTVYLKLGEDGRVADIRFEGKGCAISQVELDDFTSKLVIALKTVFDPEIPVDIYELGLIYKVDVADNKDVTVDMTLTAPGCPVAGEMPVMVKTALETVEGIGH